MRILIQVDIKKIVFEVQALSQGVLSIWVPITIQVDIPPIVPYPQVSKMVYEDAVIYSIFYSFITFEIKLLSGTSQ